MSPMPLGPAAPLASMLPIDSTPRAHGSREHAAGVVGLSEEQARTKLRELAHELEAVFLNQLFQAMRASVPRDGAIEANRAEEMFTAMLDERLAREATRQVERGLADALYRQLIKRLPPGGGPDSP